MFSSEFPVKKFCRQVLFFKIAFSIFTSLLLFVLLQSNYILLYFILWVAQIINVLSFLTATFETSYNRMFVGAFPAVCVSSISNLSFEVQSDMIIMAVFAPLFFQHINDFFCLSRAYISKQDCLNFCLLFVLLLCCHVSLNPL